MCIRDRACIGNIGNDAGCSIPYILSVGNGIGIFVQLAVYILVEMCIRDRHIATLGPGAKLYMEITLDKGRGYVSADKNKQQLQPVIGIIAVDSIYTPVLKVNYTVETVSYTHLDVYKRQ